jgi:hypothetical protein
MLFDPDFAVIPAYGGKFTPVKALVKVRYALRP